MLNLYDKLSYPFINYLFCILEEFTEILNTKTVVKEEVEVNEECVDKGIQRHNHVTLERAHRLELNTWLSCIGLSRNSYTIHIPMIYYRCVNCIGVICYIHQIIKWIHSTSLR